MHAPLHDPPASPLLEEHGQLSAPLAKALWAGLNDPRLGWDTHFHMSARASYWSLSDISRAEISYLLGDEAGAQWPLELPCWIILRFPYTTGIPSGTAYTSQHSFDRAWRAIKELS